jgi:superfamily II DNA or RNA helicase
MKDTNSLMIYLEIMQIVLPHNYSPRPYQKEVLDAIDKYNRIVCIWHRR